MRLRIIANPFRLLLLSSTGAHAQELVSTTNWDRLDDNAGMAVLLLFAACVIFIFVLSRQLRREVARRQQIEIKATDERSRLNAILNNAGVGVLLADRHARHVDVNRRWCRMFGYQRREARGKLNTRSITHPDEADAMQAHFNALLAGKIKSHTQQRRFIRKDGSIFWG